MIQGIIVSWAVIAAGVWVAAWILPGVRVHGGFGSYALVAALIGVLNVVLSKLLFIALGVLTLGLGFLLWFLTLWVVNSILIRLAAGLSDRFEVRSFGTAMLASLIVSGVSMGADALGRLLA